ncbi:hypothetical protein GCM10011428_82600 [Streptomyces violaceus]
MAGGEGDVVEAVQDGLVDLLTGGREDRDAADGRTVGPAHRSSTRPGTRPGTVSCPGDMDVDRRRRVAACAACFCSRFFSRLSRDIVPSLGVVHLLSSVSARSRFSRHRGVTGSSQGL